MRTVTAVLCMLLLPGCAGPSGSAIDSSLVSDISAEVSKLPPSPEKSNIETLLARLTEASGPSKRDEDILTDLETIAAALEPIQLDIGFSTDGKDWTNDGRDDGIEVIISPRDKTGSAVKCPGSVEAVLETEGVAILGGAKALDSWTVSQEALRYRWNESLFPGYIVRLAWNKEAPAVESAVLTVSFKPLYGKTLSARKKVTITIPSR